MAELNLGNLEVHITADGSAAIREMDNVAQAGSRVGDSLSKAGEGAGRSITAIADKMQSLGSSLTKFATLPIVGLFTAAVKGASDLTETVGKTEVVFGQFSDRVMSWSETAVQAMGLAQGTALEMASTYGDMATGMGLTGAAATDMAMNITQLAADMASFKNISTDVAAQKLNSIFTGETESLKSLGIVMTQTNLQAFALSQGITKQVSAMSQSEQVMLRYNYVMNATKNAQGDFVRTGDSLANQARKLGQTIKQMGESFGKILEPAVTRIVSALQSMVQWFSGISDTAKRIIIAISGVVAAIGPLLLVGAKVLKLIQSAKVALAALSLNPVVLGIVAATAAVAGLYALLGKTPEKAIDKTTTSWKAAEQALSTPIKTKVDVDTEELDNLKPPEGGTIPYVLTADTTTVLTNAKSVLAKLQTDEYVGYLTIDGDSQKAQDALAALESEVTALLNGGGSIEELQAAIAACEAIEIDPNIDPAAYAAVQGMLFALRGQLSALSSVAVIEVSADTDPALTEAKGILTELETNPDYHGKITIDGDSAKAQQALTDLDNAIVAYMSGESSLEELQAAIDACSELNIDHMSMNENDYQDLLSKLTDLDTVLSGIEGVEVTWSITDPEQEKQKNFQAFTDYVDGLNWTNKDFSITAAAEVDTGTITNFKDYGVAVARAATATSNFKDAVSALNELVDQDTQGKINSLVEDTTDKATKLAALVNAGIIDNDTYEEGIETLMGDTEEGVRQIETAGKQMKDQNAKFVNGIKNDDYSEAAAIYKNFAGDVEISAQDYADAMATIQAARDKDELPDAGAAGTALLGYQQKTAGNYQALIDAATAYKTAIEEADAAEQAASATLESLPGQYDLLSTAMWNYTDGIDGLDQAGRAQALQDTVNAMVEAGQIDPSQVESFTEALTSLLTVGEGEDAHLADSFEAMDIDLEGAYSQQMADAQTALDSANQAKQDALQALVDAQTAIGETDQMSTDQVKGFMGAIEGVEGLNPDTVSSLGDSFMTTATAVDSLGTALSSNDPSQIMTWATTMAEGGTTAGEDLGSSVISGAEETINNGESDIASAMGSAASGGAASASGTATSGGLGVGLNLISGIISGVSSRSGTLYSVIAAIVRQAIQSAKNAAQIKSPSRVFRDEVGVMLIKGMEVGIETQAEHAMKTIRQSMQGLISGAQSVLTDGALGIPALSTATVDYGAMGNAMADAMSNVAFNVNGRDLAYATRTDTARQQAIYRRGISIGRGRT